MKNRLIELLIFLSLILLMISPRIVLSATSSGLILWFNTIIPSLLPFLILSSLVVRLNLLKYFDRFLEPLVRKVFWLPACAIYPIFFGIISGYPVGAKISADLYANGHITKKEAQYLLSFCNNCNPMFITGFVCISMLQMKKGIWIVPVIVYLSSFISALFFRPFFLNKKDRMLPENKDNRTYEPKKSKFTLRIFDDCIVSSCSVLLKVGVYIIIFSIIAAFINRIQLDFDIGRVLLIGFVELTNGVSFLSTLALSQSTKIVLACTLIAFGGLSISAQTSSVVANEGLSTIKYLICKFINAFFAFIISLLVFFLV